MTGKPDVCAESFPPPWEVLVPLVLTPLAPPSLLVSGAGPNPVHRTSKDLMARYTRSAAWYDALSAEPIYGVGRKHAIPAMHLQDCLLYTSPSPRDS